MNEDAAAGQIPLRGTRLNHDLVGSSVAAKNDRTPPPKPFHRFSSCRKPDVTVRLDLVEQVAIGAVPLAFWREASVVPVDDERPATATRLTDDPATHAQS